MAERVAPQSSWIFSPMAPARIWAFRGPGTAACPLPRRPMFTGASEVASIMRWMCHSPGVMVVALVPSAGPVPPPMKVVVPFDSAVSN